MPREGGGDDDGNEKSARLRLKERGSPSVFNAGKVLGTLTTSFV